MKKSIYTEKGYDYTSKKEADKDKAVMHEKGFRVLEEYQGEGQYTVFYHRDELSR
jgi:hypothetical protein